MIGNVIVTWRWGALVFWAVAVAAMIWLIPSADPGAHEAASFLPADAPTSRAVAAMYENFPGSSGLSEAVIVFERPSGPLTADDHRAIEQFARRIPQATTGKARQADLEGLHVRSPASIPLPKNPLISENSDLGQAALVIVQTPVNFITLRSARIVDHIRTLLAEEALPPGLSVAVTGSCGFGRDYALAAERSNERTLWVTVAAVIVILLLVYRAPLAALVPLASISLAAIAALRLLALAARFGFHTGTAERIFVIVLLYGAGTDYALLFISRCREYLSAGLSPRSAAAAGLNATLPAILASAGTDAVGMLMLCFAEYGIFRTAGPAIALSLGVALASAMTLVPALTGIFGEKLFWPARPVGTAAEGRRTVWGRVAAWVTARPALTFTAVILLLSAPAVRGAHLTWVYDTLAGLDPTYDARRGADMVKRHWPIGEIAPVRVLIFAQAPQQETKWMSASRRIADALDGIGGVRNVRNLSRPLGSGAGVSGALAGALGGDRTRAEYLTPDGRASRLEIVFDHSPLTLSAMDTLQRVRPTIQAELDRAGIAAFVYLMGATAEIDDIRTVTQKDFRLIAVLILGMVFIAILALLRDLVLTAFMTACTVLSYLATLGASYWVFHVLLGMEGLDWKVEVFLFVVIAAVGVDYNIFLAARLAEESRRLPRLEAIRAAVTHTGPVISSCGVIMAATLGSLMAGDLVLLRQLGFALAAGMMIDTFLVRPLLLPAFAALTGRTGGRQKPDKIF